MTYEIRPATADERERFVRSTWRRSFAIARWRSDLKRHELARLDCSKEETGLASPADFFTIRGPSGAKLRSDLWVEAHARVIDDLGREALIDVAAIGDECLGWAAWTKGEVHFVYVARRFRRKGIGTALLSHAFDEAWTTERPVLSHMTHTGDLLLAAILRQQARSNTLPPATAEVHDG